MKKILLIFDGDGAIAFSGQKIHRFIRNILNVMAKKETYELAIVGSNVFYKIMEQIENVPFHYIFSENGSVYHLKKENGYELQFQNLFLNHETFSKAHLLIKKSLEFISSILSITSGHFVDIRQGYIFISLIGLQATSLQREEFSLMDMEHQYRQQLILYLQDVLREENLENSLQIQLEGRTGIAISPKEWNKLQILNHLPLDSFEKVFYFGQDDIGPSICNIEVNDPEQTLVELKKFFLK